MDPNFINVLGGLSFMIIVYEYSRLKVKRKSQPCLPIFIFTFVIFEKIVIKTPVMIRYKNSEPISMVIWINTVTVIRISLLYTLQTDILCTRVCGSKTPICSIYYVLFMLSVIECYLSVKTMY